MPVIILPTAAYFGGGYEVSNQQLNALSETLNLLSKRISAIEDALEANGISPENEETSVLNMLDDIFAGDLADDDDNTQEPEYIELLDNVFSGKDSDYPQYISGDDAELFGDFDYIFNP